MTNLQTLCEKTARILSNDYNVHIVFDKEGSCCTNGNVITLPYSEQAHESLLISLLGHEVAHVKFTNFATSDKIVKMKGIKHKEFLFYICNALEDARVEKLISKEYAGFVPLFKQASKILTEERKSYLHKMTVAQKILDMLYMRAANEDTSLYGKELNTFFDTYLMKDIVDVADTNAVLKIAVKIYQSIIEHKHISFKDLKKKKSTSQLSIVTGKNHKGKVAADKAVLQLSFLEKLTEELKHEDVINDLTMIKDSTKELIRKTIVKGGAKAYTIHPVVQQKDVETIAIPLKGNEYKYLHETVKQPLQYILTKLQRIMNDKKFYRWGGAVDKGRRINRKALYKIPTNEINVFQKKQESKIRDIAFTLLIDESGSMSGEKNLQAKRTAIMFGEVLNKLQLPFEIIGYTSGSFTTEQVKEYESHPQLKWQQFNRVEPLRHDIFKSFNEKYDKVKERLCNIKSEGANYDAEMLQFAIKRILKRPESKKLILWIADSNICGGKEAQELTKRVISEFDANSKNKVIGIGIQTDIMKDYASLCVEIRDIGQLGQNVINLLDAAINGKI